MIVIVTAGECLDRWIWDDVCKMKGYSEWAINEGMMDSDDEIELTEEEARELGFIK